MKWANVGVGKLHRAHVLQFFLLDAAGRPVLSADAQTDPRAWLPGEHDLTESFAVPSALEVGEYTVALTLVDPGRQHRPFRLAMDAPEKEGRYAVSKVNVK
jgi:hypothetical protein